MEKLTALVIALIKRAIEKQLSEYIEETDYNNHNFIVLKAVEALKEDFELSENFDVTPEEVEEHFEEFIEDWVKESADNDTSIWNLPNGVY